MEKEKDLTCVDCISFDECLIWSPSHIYDDTPPCKAFVHFIDDRCPKDKSYLRRKEPIAFDEGVK